ncbi:zinc finger protein RFP-like [Podarcis muralis]
MDRENITSMLLLETVCSVCQTCFRDPVILDCGHNFCHPCVAKCEEFCGRVLCPLCKNPQPSRKQNMKLGTVTELFQQLTVCARQASREDEICLQHEQPLIFFCKRDKALRCSKCVESVESPAVLGVAEAVQEYKDCYVQYADTIKKEKEEIMAHKLSTDLESQSMLAKAEIIKQRMTSAFKEINEFLAQQEKLLLAQHAEIMLDIARGRDKHVVRLFRRVAFLDSILEEMEKCHRTPNELLKGVRRTMEKFEEEFVSPVAFPPVKRWGLYAWHDLTFLLHSAVEKFTGTLVSGYPMQEVSVILDPDMGSPQYSLSDDLKSLWKDGTLDLSVTGNIPGHLPFVLGRNVFTAGRHCWEVTVHGEDDWAVGVTRISLKRKKRSTAAFSPSEGIWAIGKWKGGYAMFTSPKTPVPMRGEVLKRIRVSLNCDGKQVSFANADSGAVLAKFQTASFLGESLLPIFWLDGKTCLSVS